MYGLFSKCLWGQDGWILAKFFFCVFMDRGEVEVHKLAKKERGQYPTILTKQTWSLKDLLYGFWWNFACGIQRVVPSGQDGSILPARVANHSARFCSSCPLSPRLHVIPLITAIIAIVHYYKVHKVYHIILQIFFSIILIARRRNSSAERKGTVHVHVA